MKRIILFLATNLAVMLVLSIVLSIVFRVLGIDSRSIGGLLVFAAVFGFGGSFISLFMSKWMAKRSTGAVVITQPRNATEQWLFDTVRRQAQQAGIGMPEVAIYDSPEMNAFATGASRNNALVAVSTGLMRNMREEEVEAVLAHEVSHVANGDMVTLTLIQGVVNTFVIFFARLIAGAISGNRNDEGGSSNGFAYMMTVFVLEMAFGVLASIIVMWFSRQREYRADAGAAKLVGANKMVAALERLRNNHESQLEGSMMAFGIASKPAASELFLSHPPLEKRIAALRGAF
ncbi:Zn-dependent protease with chaperone function [Rheinheimera sp. A13L]|jgi:heat shock protein HtpX|uniref:protease HtpX n=1 Tax=Rheinheimera sp. A13L TaxID=506534 RepID=UPI0002124B7C|nr:protease HtpX [Rheinheimera sp. A13L]EGM79387.1 Zn-dependent protease with chaperone function [Rheinheimera sp. A13L]